MHALVQEAGDRLVTARTTTLKGADAGRYYVEGLPSYYLDSGEPPGRWRGIGAEALGLAGDVEDEAFMRLMAGEHPATGHQLGTRYIDRSVRGFDITCSAPKSVSLLFGLGDDHVRREALAAHDAAVTAVADWIEAHAHCRYRVNGEVMIFDAEGIGAATFRQHTSRALDPQLHTHVVIANRVLSPDGRWLALDARTIKHDQRTLSALYHAALRSELTARLGVRWREPLNGIAEIADVPDELLAAFSTRTEDIDQRLEDKLDRFDEAFGREPTPRERWRLEREAVTDSRPAKTSVDAFALREEWASRAAGLGISWEDVQRHAIAQIDSGRTLDDATTRAVIDQALVSLADHQSTWRPAELVRELATALPTDTVSTASDLVSRLDTLADQVAAWRCIDLSRTVPAGVPLRRDGRPVTESALDRALTLDHILAEEEGVLELAEGWTGPGDEHPRPRVVTGDQAPLTGDQLAVATAIAGDQRLVLVVGPAGTGKTTALRPAVQHLKQEGRAVFGVAPSATAAVVLATDTGVDSDTLDKLLTEHRLDRPPGERYDLPAGATVLVDEAAMVPTPKLAELFDLADRRHWRLALLGDPLQFSAVGRGGLFAHLVDTLGAIELGRVHRFRQEWEADASLRLRRGDLSVVDVYQRNGRLHDGTATRMRAQMIRAWWDATHGGETASMMAPTNEAVVALNHRAQQLRIDAGELADGPAIEAGPYTLHVGDIVATRQNARTLRTDRNAMVKNRDHWTITAISGDGTITASGRTGTVTLPPEYVRSHVELAYAETSHANQGRTVDRSFLLLDGPSNAAGIYVPMTRGRLTNEAFVVVHDEQTAADIVTESLTRTWVDLPAVERREELRAGRESAQARDRVLPPHVLRQLLERAHETDQAMWRKQWTLDAAHRELANINHRRAALERTIEDYETRIALSQRTLAEHDKPLHRRRHRYDIEGARTQLGWMPDALDKARDELGQLATREARARQAIAAAIVEHRERDGDLGEGAAIAARIDGDRRARAREATDNATVTLRLGERPPVGHARDLWDEAAGRLLQHEAAFAESPKRVLFEESARAASSRTTIAALNKLDLSLDRSPEVGRGRSLGLEL